MVLSDRQVRMSFRCFPLGRAEQPYGVRSSVPLTGPSERIAEYLMPERTRTVGVGEVQYFEIRHVP